MPGCFLRLERIILNGHFLSLTALSLIPRCAPNTTFPAFAAAGGGNFDARFAHVLEYQVNATDCGGEEDEGDKKCKHGWTRTEFSQWPTCYRLSPIEYRVVLIWQSFGCRLTHQTHGNPDADNHVAQRKACQGQNDGQWKFLGPQ